MSETPEQDPTVCQACGKNPAAVHVRRVSAGEEVEMRLCVSCAQEHGLEPSGTEALSADSLDKLFQGMRTTEDSRTSCPRCGLVFSEFKSTGRLGCAECYGAFAPLLEPLLRRVHGSTEHLGRAPASEGESRENLARLRRLNEELDRAVGAEDYERAAQLRDEIRRLEESVTEADTEA
jgi:protein arginine kinase activator